jgi:hypothetical protein
MGTHTPVGLPAGVATTMIFPEEYLLSRLFTRDLAQFYEDFYAR